MQGRNASGEGISVPSPLSKEDVISILPLEMREQRDIAEYMRLIDDLPAVNAMNGPMMMRELLKAKDNVSRLHANALCKLEIAYRERKQKHAIAKLDKAAELLEKKGLKSTDSNMTAMADRDRDYIEACNTEAYWKAWEKYLKDKVETLQAAHDDAKKIYGNTYEPRGGVSSLPSGE